MVKRPEKAVALILHIRICHHLDYRACEKGPLKYFIALEGPNETAEKAVKCS